MSKKDEKLGLKELIAMGVGGMIGGGIFSILGLAVDIAGHAAPLAFVIGSIIAFLSGYSYIKLALVFNSDGASFTYLEHAFPKHPNVAGITGWAVIIGYVGTLALYAFTFGAYGADLLGVSGSDNIRMILSLGILVALMGINLRGVGASGIAEDLIVYSKILILAFFAFIGLHEVDLTKTTPLFDHGISSVFMAAALIFVAFEGFQLITNQICETNNPTKNLPRGIYGSITITSIIYILIAIIAVVNLTADQLLDAEEYALAVVAEPILGTGGRVLIGIAALLSTSSAINSTLFGASRMMAVMATRNNVPHQLSIKNQSGIPFVSLIVLTILGIVFTMLNTLETIASFSSVVFLLVCAAVSIANLKLHHITKCNKMVVYLALMLIISTIILLFVYLLEHNIQTLIWVLSLLAVTAIFEIFVAGYLRNHMK